MCKFACHFLCAPLTNYRTLIKGFAAIVSFIDWYNLHCDIFGKDAHFNVR